MINQTLIKPKKPDLVDRKISQKRRNILTKLLRESNKSKWYTISELSKDSDVSIPGVMKTLGYLAERGYLEQKIQSTKTKGESLNSRLRHEFLLNKDGQEYTNQAIKYYLDCEAYETSRRSRRKTALI